jgi:hypothetical protein
MFVSFKSQISGWDLDKFVKSVGGFEFDYVLCSSQFCRRRRELFSKQSLAHRGTWQNEFSKLLLFETFCYMAPD